MQKYRNTVFTRNQLVFLKIKITSLAIQFVRKKQNIHHLLNAPITKKHLKVPRAYFLNSQKGTPNQNLLFLNQQTKLFLKFQSILSFRL